MRLVDSHSHVQASAFDHDRDLVISAARDSGVVRMLVPGWDSESSRAAWALRETFDVDVAMGFHPHVASQVTDYEWRSMAVTVMGNPGVVAVGETGLDYDRGFSPRSAQIDSLRYHLKISLETGKPAILHCRSKPGQRDAQEDLLRMLDEEGRPPALLHSFSGPVDYGERALEVGLYISFSGLVFREGEEASAEVARLTPADRLLVETDCPYLSPPGAPKRRNEPRYVEITARWLAEQRGQDPDALGEQLVANYDRLFSRRPT